MSKGARIIVGALAIVALIGIYIFQRFDWYSNVIGNHESDTYAPFIFNKTVRFLLNDLACLVLIKVLFWEEKYLRVAWVVFFIELLFILPLYFVIKLWWEGDSEISSPLLSQIHRLVVNPVLMILLMIAFYYQRLKGGPAQ